MSVEAFVTSWLTKNVAVRKLAGSRVYPIELPQGAGVPAVTYYLVGMETQRTLTGLAGLTKARLTIDCWATSYSDAKALALSIRGNVSNPGLDGYRGKVGGLYVQSCKCTNVIDLIEKPVHGDEAGVKHMALDFEIVYEDVEPTVFADSEPYKEPE